MITSFLNAGLAQEVNVYVTPRLLGSAGQAGISQALAAGLTHEISLAEVETKAFGPDVRIRGLVL